MQFSGGHRPFLIRIQNHQVGVRAGRDHALLRIQPGYAGRIRAGVFHQLRQGDPSLSETLGIQKDQPFLDARRAAGALCKVLRALLFLFCEGKRAVIRRHRVQLVPGQRLPQRVPVLLPAQRRRHQRLQAFPRIIVQLFIQQQVLRAGFRPEMLLSGRPGPADFFQPFPGGQVNNVDRRLPGRPGQVQQPADRFRLCLRRPAHRMPFRLGFAFPHKPFPPVGHHPMVLAVCGDQDLLPPGPLQHLHQVQVVQPVIVGHIDFEAGNAFLPGNLRHILQRFIVHMLQHAVEAVVHRGVSVRQPVVFLHLVPGAAALRAEGHVVHNRGCPAAGRRGRSCIEIVDHPGNPHVQVHVRMDIHRSRQHNLPRRLNHLCNRGTVLFVAQHLQNLPVLNQDIPLICSRFRYDCPATNDRFHFYPFCCVCRFI